MTQVSGPPEADFEPERPIGIIGASALGLAVAQRLAAAKTRVLVCDADPARLAAVAIARPYLDIAANLFDLAVECETVFACLETTDDLIAAIFGSEDRPGLRLRFAPGGLVIDMSTVGRPRDVLKVQGFLGTRGIGLIDCFAVGGADAVGRGEARLLLGGFPEFLERAEPALAHLGAILRTGQLGTAHAAAAILSGLAAARQVAALEAARVAAACSIRPDAAAQFGHLADVNPDATRLEALHQLAAQHGLVPPGLQGVRAAIAIEAAAAEAKARTG